VAANAFLIKAPHLVFDFLCAVLIYGLIAVGGLWGGARAGPGWGRLAALLYLYNPAVIWGSGYWGQLDSVHTFFGMAAIAALAFQRVSFSGVLLAASGLMKPLAAPLAPVIGASMLARKGARAFAMGTGSGVICALVILLPFIVTGRGWDVLERIVRDLDSMAYTSMNAHTLWMLVGPWRASNEAIVAGVTPQTIGLLLFVIAMGLLLFRSWSWLKSQELGDADYLARLVVLAAAVYSSFYFFSTNMHENHLFLAAPLLLLVAGRSRAFALLAAGCAVATWFNMMIHDIDLPYLLPWPLSARSPLLDPYLVYDSPRNMTRHAYGDDLHFTWLQLVGIAGNMLLVMWVCGFTYLKAWRGRGE
jgi:Gpi18-like mannosyltransferase